jgi:glycosyltransferase involved in cell wall biosynthesis
VVIPALDEAKNIGNCLKSLQAQNRQSDEVIVVDNGSLDDTPSIACMFGAKVLSYPRPDIRHGNLGMVRQKGTEYARGDIVVSTDADCIYPEDWLQKIERHFSDNEELAVLGGPVFDGNRSPFRDLVTGLGNFHRSYWSGWGVPWFLGGNTSFRREAFLRTEGYQGAGGQGPVEEWVLSFRLARVGEWVWDDGVYCYTDVPESAVAYEAAKILAPAPLAAWATAALIHL